MTGYYDLILGLIPVSFLGTTGLLSVVGLSLTSALSVGGLAAVGLVGHALFVNGPVDETPDAQSPSTAPSARFTDDAPPAAAD